MSYEITNPKNENFFPGKYSKIEDDCQVLLQKTALDDEKYNENLRKDSELKIATLNSNNLANQNRENKELTSNLLEENSESVSGSNKGDTKKLPTRTPNHKSFDISSSIATFMRFISFRKKKKKFKQVDNSSINTSQVDIVSTQSKTSRTKNDEISVTEKSLKNGREDDKPNVFSRFVRTFSFLYKRNPNPTNNQNFKRSQSLKNYRSARSLSNIKYSSSQSRTFNSAMRQNVNNIKHPMAPIEPTIRRDRAKSDMPIISNTTAQTNHTNLNDSKRSEKNLDETTETILRNVDAKETQRKDMSKEVVSQSSLINRRRHLVSSGQETPAVCGIQNHGNTCFINSVIQCLNNTDLLAEYFVFNHFREDLLQSKHMAKKYGTKGELTEQLAILLKSLWSCMYSSDISMKFKKTVSKHGEQYNGYEQHDAQEFLLWLLDKCHEDLNVELPKSVNKNFLQFKKGYNKKSNNYIKKHNTVSCFQITLKH